MGHHKSVNKTLSFTEPVYQRLEKLAKENSYVTFAEAPNVSRFIREFIIKTFLDIELLFLSKPFFLPSSFLRDATPIEVSHADPISTPV